MVNVYALRNGKRVIKPEELPKFFEETNRKLEEQGAKLIRWNLDQKFLWVWFGRDTIYMYGITEEGTIRSVIPYTTIPLAEEDPHTDDAVVAFIEDEEGLFLDMRARLHTVLKDRSILGAARVLRNLGQLDRTTFLGEMQNERLTQPTLDFLQRTPWVVVRDALDQLLDQESGCQRSDIHGPPPPVAQHGGIYSYIAQRMGEGRMEMESYEDVKDARIKNLEARVEELEAELAEVHAALVRERLDRLSAALAGEGEVHSDDLAAEVDRLRSHGRDFVTEIIEEEEGEFSEEHMQRVDAALIYARGLEPNHPCARCGGAGWWWSDRPVDGFDLLEKCDHALTPEKAGQA